MQSPNRIAGRPADWRGKGLIRILLLIGMVIAIAGLASIFGVGRLDLPAVVMGEDAEFMRTALRQYDLDIAAHREL